MRAVVFHRHGVPEDLNVEDVAEAPGASYRGRALGTFGALSCYSFFANKIITTGEGGMVLCRDPDLDTALQDALDRARLRDRL